MYNCSLSGRRKNGTSKLPNIVHAVIAGCQQNDSKTRFEVGNGDYGNLVGILAIRIHKALVVNSERSFTKGLIEISDAKDSVLASTLIPCIFRHGHTFFD